MTQTSWPKTSFSTSTTRPSALTSRWLQFTVTEHEETMLESEDGEKRTIINLTLCMLSPCSWRSVFPISCLPWWSKIWRPWTPASWGVRSPPARNRRYSYQFLYYFFLKSTDCLISFFPGGWAQPIVIHGFCCFSQITTGLLLANSQVIFEKGENSPLNLIGECLQHTSKLAGRPLNDFFSL